MEINGRVTGNAKVSEVKGGKKVVNFSIAVNRSYRKDGETIRTVKYIDCAFWRNAGVAEFIKKGTLVELSGEIGARAYIDKDGKAQGVLTFTIDKINFLGGGERSENSRPAQNSTNSKPALSVVPGEDDDLPF